MTFMDLAQNFCVYAPEIFYFIINESSYYPKCGYVLTPPTFPILETPTCLFKNLDVHHLCDISLTVSKKLAIPLPCPP